MKLTKKKVFVVALAISLIAILSFSTLAWFTDNDKVTNNFMIATSDDDTEEDIFNVDVYETTPEGEGDQDGYDYEDILPGDVLKKEAFVENTGYYDQYIRVTVTVSDAAAWMDALNTNGAVPKLEQIVNGYDRNDNTWTDTESAYDAQNDTLVYTLYYNGILQGDIENMYDNSMKNKVTVFTEVKIPGSMTKEQAAAFDNQFSIDVFAEAVQTENLGLDRTQGDGAKEAFEFVAANS